MKPIRHRFTRIVSGTLALVGLPLLFAATAAAAPVFEVHAAHAPTHLAPGEPGSYELNVGNVGDAPTDGAITLEATFPPGVTVTAATDPFEGFAWECAISPGGGSISCTWDPFAFFGPIAPHKVPCGEFGGCPVYVSVDVGPGASGTAPTSVAISDSGAPPATASFIDTTTISSTPAGFGINRLTGHAINPDRTPVTQAGAHPWDATTRIELNRIYNPPEEASDPPFTVDGSAKTIQLDLPPGFVADPTAVPPCPQALFRSGDATNCPLESQIGIGYARVNFGGAPLPSPIYRLEPPLGVPAQFGIGVLGSTPVFVNGGLSADGGYALTAKAFNITQQLALMDSKVTLWGVPSDPSHDAERGFCGISDDLFDTCPSEGPSKPFLTNPTGCSGGPLTTTVHTDSWEDPNAFETASFDLPANTGCNQVEFEPTIEARPTTNVSDSPTGLDVDLHIPQNDDPDGLGVAHLKRAVVSLPEDLNINPSSANGLTGCSPAQVDLNGPGAANCPDGSRVGTVEVETPLIDHPLPGGVYVATPFDNPFNSLLAIYVTIADPQSGVVVKIAGHVKPDPQTGQLTTSFDESPQLPVEHFKLKLFGGALAPLRTPAVCGEYSTTAELTPWSAPDSGPPTVSVETYEISQGSSGGDCATSESALPHSPEFDAGTVQPVAGAYSPFIVNLRREDGSQRFSSVKLTPPPGLTAKLAGTPYCPDPALAAAASKSGKDEKANPSCPAASEVGDVFAGAGAGPAPYYAPGKAYLAGPYKGAPLSLAIVTPAVAGPFDLGTIVVRTALHIDPRTAEITAVSDPIPSILEGIPLDVRSVSIRLSKPEFTKNPTSCEEMFVSGELISTLGIAAQLSKRFQLAECTRLGFKPELTLRLKGGTQRGDHPALTAVLRPRPGDANISRLSVALPPSEFLDQAHIGTVCTRVQFASDACPKGAIYGRSVAHSQLLDNSLSGPVYLRSSDNKLPDLVVALRGPAHQPIRVETAGRTDTVNGGLRNTFAFVPDAPITKVVLRLQGGKKGLLVNSRDICARTYRARVRFVAHNGRVHTIRPKLMAQGCKKRAKKVKRRGHGRKGMRGAKRSAVALRSTVR